MDCYSHEGIVSWLCGQGTSLQDGDGSLCGEQGVGNCGAESLGWHARPNVQWELKVNLKEIEKENMQQNEEEEPPSVFVVFEMTK